VNVRESEDTPSNSVRPRRTSAGSHPLKGLPCSTLRRRIGTDIVAKAAPDGYTLVMIYTSHTTNASLQRLPYDPIADFAPITMVTSAPLVLIVPAASNMHTVKDLIAAGKAQPLSYGSAGVGSGGHLAGELFRTTTGINATHVPYKGAAPASIDVAGG